MAKFRKRPVIIEAEQWTGTKESWDKILSLGLTNWKPGETNTQTFYIETLEGNMLVNKRDWIIKDVHGEFYPCKPDIFEKTYSFIKPKPKKDNSWKKTREMCS